MKKLLAFSIGLLSLCCWVSCSSQTPEEQAAQAALSYYQRLMEGYPDGLQAAKSDNDSLPADYREQRQKIFQQYAHDIEQKHGGLQAVSLSQNAARRDSFRIAGDDQWQQVVYAFLLLQFRDSTQEEIVVPMVQREGEWVLK
jgi:hypothetical protein